MRRAGKTFYLYQCMRDRLDRGASRDSLVYLNFEDERLAGIEVAHLTWLLEEYYRRFPDRRDTARVSFFLDEIQLISGWETFVRRVLDSENVEIFVSGSSAKLLSREIATSLRGRGTETIVYPFSFREYLHHAGLEVPPDPLAIRKGHVSRLEAAFLDYTKTGGFPEAQGLLARDRLSLLQSYVEVVIFRDVIERHGVSNVLALKALVRQLLSAPGGRFSVHRFHNDLRSQGIAVAKETLYSLLSHLEDAFLIRMLSIHTSSERQRQSNPRKVYPLDPGLALAFDRTGRPNTGAMLETIVAIELERRGWETSYLTTGSGYEVDFYASRAGSSPLLVQVTADLTDSSVRERESRALIEGASEQSLARPILLTGTSGPEVEGIESMSIWRWLLISASS